MAFKGRLVLTPRLLLSALFADLEPWQELTNSAVDAKWWCSKGNWSSTIERSAVVMVPWGLRTTDRMWIISCPSCSHAPCLVIFSHICLTHLIHLNHHVETKPLFQWKSSEQSTDLIAIEASLLLERFCSCAGRWLEGGIGPQSSLRRAPHGCIVWGREWWWLLELRVAEYRGDTSNVNVIFEKNDAPALHNIQHFKNNTGQSILCEEVTVLTSLHHATDIRSCWSWRQARQTFLQMQAERFKNKPFQLKCQCPATCNFSSNKNCSEHEFLSEWNEHFEASWSLAHSFSMQSCGPIIANLDSEGLRLCYVCTGGSWTWWWLHFSVVLFGHCTGCTGYSFILYWGGLFICFFFSRQVFGFFCGFLVLCFPVSLIFCFSASLLILLLCFPASQLFLFLCFSCFSASLLFAFPSSLLFCFSVFPASLLLYFCAFLLLLFYFFFSSVMCFCCSTSCSFASLFPVFTVSMFFIFCCFILFCSYPKWKKSWQETRHENLNEL